MTARVRDVGGSCRFGLSLLSSSLLVRGCEWYPALMSQSNRASIVVFSFFSVFLPMASQGRRLVFFSAISMKHALFAVGSKKIIRSRIARARDGSSIHGAEHGGLDDDRTFEDYDPAVEWSHAADADTVAISLPGFKKEELRTQLTSHGYVRARGERQVVAGSSSSSKWIRFQKDLKLPDNCDVDGIRSKFGNEKLTVTLPKKIRPSPPDGPAPPMQEEEEDGGDDKAAEDDAEEGAAGEKAGETASGRRRPIRWLLVTVAAAFFVGVTAYVAWRGCAAGAGGHGPGELAGAGSGVNEM